VTSCRDRRRSERAQQVVFVHWYRRDPGRGGHGHKLHDTLLSQIKPGSERVQALADILRSRYVAIVHRLQICPIVHN